MFAEYIFTGDTLAPAVITIGGNSAPVWIQQNWTEGEFARIIRQNGCGHCCCAMALNLCGTKITPYEEYLFCRENFGFPRENGELTEENYHSVSGIAKVLSSFGIKAEYFGVPLEKAAEAAEHIENSLKDGKLVIFWSHPSQKLADNPFSPGDHYVLAAGLDRCGRIVIANSSSRAKAENGIQLTDKATIEKALFEGCEPGDYTWGRQDIIHSGGYVIIDYESKKGRQD